LNLLMRRIGIRVALLTGCEGHPHPRLRSEIWVYTGLGAGG
jgi:hypothetical protein